LESGAQQAVRPGLRAWDGEGGGCAERLASRDKPLARLKLGGPAKIGFSLLVRRLSGGRTRPSAGSGDKSPSQAAHNVPRSKLWGADPDARSNAGHRRTYRRGRERDSRKRAGRAYGACVLGPSRQSRTAVLPRWGGAQGAKAANCQRAAPGVPGGARLRRWGAGAHNGHMYIIRCARCQEEFLRRWGWFLWCGGGRACWSGEAMRLTSRRGPGCSRPRVT